MATPLTPRHVAMQQAGFYDGSQGYGAGQEGAAYRALTPQQRAQIDATTKQISAQAVAPALAEPLHQWEKTGLTGLSDTGSVAGNSQMQGAMQALQQLMGGNYNFMGQANTATQGAIKPVTMQEVQGIANPYAEGQKANLSKSAEKVRAQITSGQGQRGARSFGDTSTGVQNAMLNESVLFGENDIDYKSFQDALAQVNTERNRSLSGGGQFGNLAGTQTGGLQALSGIAGGVRDAGIEDIMNKIQAGSYVRDYNQGINDRIENDMLAEQDDEYNKISKVLQLLQSYQSSGDNYVPGKTSTASKVGSAAGAIASVAGLFSDARLKENIKKVGEQNGVDIVEFNYKGTPWRYRGVLAQQVAKVHPHAIGEKSGYMTVNYGAIGVPFQEIG